MNENDNILVECQKCHWDYNMKKNKGICPFCKHKQNTKTI